MCCARLLKHLSSRVTWRELILFLNVLVKAWKKHESTSEGLVSTAKRHQHTTFFTFKSTNVNLLSCLFCLSDKNGRLGAMIGQLACQSNSLQRINSDANCCDHFYNNCKTTNNIIRSHTFFSFPRAGYRVWNFLATDQIAWRPWVLKNILSFGTKLEFISSTSEPVNMQHAWCVWIKEDALHDHSCTLWHHATQDTILFMGYTRPAKKFYNLKIIEIIILSELCILKQKHTIVSLKDVASKNYLNFRKTICTDLLCWLHLVPLLFCSFVAQEINI